MGNLCTASLLHQDAYIPAECLPTMKLTHYIFPKFLKAEKLLTPGKTRQEDNL